jgi:hypothetical protein
MIGGLCGSADQLSDAEEAARDSLWEGIGPNTGITISELNLATHRAISAYLSALEAQGLKIVPVEPTEEMKGAGRNAMRFQIGDKVPYLSEPK